VTPAHAGRDTAELRVIPELDARSGPDGERERSGLVPRAHLLFLGLAAAAGVVLRVAEEGEDLVASRVRIGAPHLDELAAEVTVEQEVAREVGLVARPDVEQVDQPGSR
jgi:hypothetical protein